MYGLVDCIIKTSLVASIYFLINEFIRACKLLRKPNSKCERMSQPFSDPCMKMPMDVDRNLTGAQDRHWRCHFWYWAPLWTSCVRLSLLNLSLNHSRSLHTHAISPCCRLLLSSPSSILCWHVERVRKVCVRVWVSKRTHSMYTRPQALLLFSPYSLLDCRGEMNHTVRCSENK